MLSKFGFNRGRQTGANANANAIGLQNNSNLYEALIDNSQFSGEEESK